MAARNKLTQTDETRLKIQTSQLINRLSDHVFKDKEVSITQMKAIEILLRKSLPDLAAVQHTGDPENPLQMTIVTGVPRRE